jgi:hypothetical protein
MPCKSEQPLTDLAPQHRCIVPHVIVQASSRRCELLATFPETQLEFWGFFLKNTVEYSFRMLVSFGCRMHACFEKADERSTHNVHMAMAVRHLRF